ncbi:MAG TPA: HD domain-containing phosphohydrolase [Solirubrobacteraceae bacterium]
MRRAELAGALSLATDLATGQPAGHALRVCRLADRLGERLGLDAPVRGDAYWAALLHSSGCTADAYEAAQLYGDDIALRADWAVVGAARPLEIVRFLRERVGTGPRLVAAVVAGPARARRGFAAHCEIAGRLAGRLGLGAGVSAALEAAFERWDGRGFPAGRRGDDLPLAARVLHVARDAEVFRALGGADEAAAVVARRAGRAYDPRVAQGMDMGASA